MQHQATHRHHYPTFEYQLPQRNMHVGLEIRTKEAALRPICSHSLHSMAVCRHYKQWITPRATMGVAMGVVLGGFRLKCGAFGTVQHHFSTSLKFCSRKLRGKWARTFLLGGKVVRLFEYWFVTGVILCSLHSMCFMRVCACVVSLSFSFDLF